jgi:SAM-dependent methyltransferase
MSGTKREELKSTPGSQLSHAKDKTQKDKRILDEGVYRQFGKVYDDIYIPIVDYPSDARFIDKLVSKFGNTSKNPSEAMHILDVGCGTGSHLIELAKLGRYKATGLDISPVMIAKAKIKASRLNRRIRPIFLLGDMAHFDLPRRFHVAICMLNSFGYAVGKTDAQKVLSNIKRHLAPEGLLIVEFWQKGVIQDDETHYIALPKEYSFFQRNVRRIMKFKVLDSVVKIHFGFEVFGIRFVLDFGPRTMILRKFFSEVHLLQLYQIDEFVDLAHKCGFEILGLFNRGRVGEIVRELEPPKPDSLRVLAVMRSTKT